MGDGGMKCGHCTDCRFWIDICDRAPLGWRECVRKALGGSKLEIAAYVPMDEHAPIVTAPDFGCMQFEAWS